MKSSVVRWLPALLAPVLVAGAIAAPSIAAAIPPSLPERSVAQVLTLSATGERVRGYTATIEQRVDLGLPDLSALTGASSGGYSASGSAAPSSSTGGNSSAAASQALSLLTTEQNARVQVSGQGLKVQLTTGTGEKSLTVNSKEAWIWDWDAKEATRYAFPQAPELTAKQQQEIAKLRAQATSRLVQLNPQEIATSLLKKTSKDTTVSLGSNVRVAGQAAYEVVLTPKQAASLVRDVRVAIDAKTGMVLRTQVWAKADDKLAYSLAYTSLDYTVPNASAFTFTPPSDAKVIQKSLPEPTRAQRGEVRQLETKVKAANTPAEREQLKQELLAQVREALTAGGATPRVADTPDLSAASLSGSGWASVIHLPAGTLNEAALKQIKPLVKPLGNGAYGTQTTLVSVRIGADGSLTAGSVALSDLG